MMSCWRFTGRPWCFSGWHSSGTHYGRSRHTQAHPTLTCPTRLDSSHLPNPHAIVNDRINRMELEQYPPSPALFRNELLPYPRLTGIDY